jgi:tetratricopeptide (TPR) repeat protein
MLDLCTALFAVVLASGTATAGSTATNAAAWTERLAAAASETERTTARTALRAIAAGPTDDAETREAIFALAEDALSTGADLDVVLKATVLYPEDPRTPPLMRSLAEAQLRAGDPFGAHLMFRDLLAMADPPVDLLPLAASNAARVADMAAAFEWARAVPEGASLSRESQIHRDRALLVSAAALDRHELALEAYRRLAKRDASGLRVDPQALGAAARTLEDVGLAEEAIAAYESFVNVHPRDPERPRALLALGRLLARTERATGSRVHLELLVRDHPDTREAQEARLDLLELDGEPAAPGKIDGYVAAIREATDAGAAVAACRRFAETFVGAGRPMDLVDTVTSLARGGEGEADELTSMVARDCLAKFLDPVLALLDARDDLVGIAATAAAAESVGAEIPDARAAVVGRALSGLGLGTSPLAADGVAEARACRAGCDWEPIVERLRASLDTASASPGAAAEIERWLGEGLFRLGRKDEARTVLERALGRSLDPAARRPLEVLLADVLFAAGETTAACERYRAASERGASPWVDRQLERCREGAS